MSRSKKCKFGSCHAIGAEQSWSIIKYYTYINYYSDCKCKTLDAQSDAVFGGKYTLKPSKLCNEHEIYIQTTLEGKDIYIFWIIAKKTQKPTWVMSTDECRDHAGGRANFKIV